MNYSEMEQTEFFYFTDKEKDLIEGFLEGFGYIFETNIVCGSCCEMYADEYWIGGIGGGWKEKDHEKEFKKFAEDNGISCSFSGFNPNSIGYTISADPNAKEIKVLN